MRTAQHCYSMLSHCWQAKENNAIDDFYAANVTRYRAVPEPPHTNPPRIPSTPPLLAGIHDHCYTPSPAEHSRGLHYYRWPAPTFIPFANGGTISRSRGRQRTAQMFPCAVATGNGGCVPPSVGSYWTALWDTFEPQHTLGLLFALLERRWRAVMDNRHADVFCRQTVYRGGTMLDCRCTARCADISPMAARTRLPLPFPKYSRALARRGLTRYAGGRTCIHSLPHHLPWFPRRNTTCLRADCASDAATPCGVPHCPPRTALYGAYKPARAAVKDTCK